MRAHRADLRHAAGSHTLACTNRAGVEVSPTKYLSVPRRSPAPRAPVRVIAAARHTSGVRAAAGRARMRAICESHIEPATMNQVPTMAARMSRIVGSMYLRHARERGAALLPRGLLGLQEYMNRYTAANDAERVKLAGTLRASP
jgi:hypothetical protein